MKNDIVTFVFNNRPLRITCLKDGSIYLFSEDIALMLTESLKSIPIALSEHIIQNYIGKFTENTDKTAFYHDGKITPLIKYVSLIPLFQAFNNFEDERLKQVGDDTVQLQIFLCRAIVEARKHFGIDMMASLNEIIDRAKGNDSTPKDLVGDGNNIVEIQSGSMSNNNEKYLSKFSNTEDAFKAIEDIFKSAETNTLSSEFIAKQLNVTLTENIVENEKESLPLKNVLYLISQRKKYIYKRDGKNAWLSKVIDNNPKTEPEISELDMLLEKIRAIVLLRNCWIEKKEICKALNIPDNKNLVEGMFNSKIGQLLYSYLRKEGFGYKKISLDENDRYKYEIWVAPPSMGEMPCTAEPGEQKKQQATGLNEKELILNCVNAFNGLYGRSGIAKILKGSVSLKHEEYNAKALNSEFYEALSCNTRKNITELIDELIESGDLVLKSLSYGRPLVYIAEGKSASKPENKVVAKVEENIGENSKEDNEYLNKITELVRNGENLFITGYAGTGKSYILNKLKKIFKIDVTSTTGLAAVNVQGQTIHSWAGVGICNKPVNQVVENILKRSTLKKQISNCKILAIDEISMLDAKTFDYIDSVLRIVRDGEKPFGGIQILLFGDFFQLPPVEKEMNGFCFNSNCWRELDLKTVFLEKIYRQEDVNFIKSLNNIRLNSITDEDVRLFKNREVNYNTYNSDILHIFSTNKEADNYNSFKFNAVKKPVHTFVSEDKIHKKKKIVVINKENPDKELTKYDLITWEMFDKFCKAPQTLELKESCKVMLLKNHNFTKGLINGSCGTVLEIEEDSIRVKFDNGVDEVIPKHTFEYYREGELAVTRDQYPLRLAYGITIHKSQGMTLDRLVVDCNKIFECGQAYVALSRVKTLEGLCLRSFNPDKVVVNQEVVDFYDSIKPESCLVGR